MAEEPEISSDPGKLIRTTKQLAATRQIQAAIKHFRNDDYECAITLAAAAEGLLPPTGYPHMFSVLKDSPFFEKGDINLFHHLAKTSDRTRRNHYSGV
jgi:hypothetical protein